MQIVEHAPVIEIQARLVTLPSVAGSEVRARLLATPTITMPPIAWRGGTSKGATSAPSIEPLSADSLIAIGSLEADSGAVRDLDEADALAGMETLEATDQEPPAAGTNAKVGAGAGAVIRFAVGGAMA